MTVQGSIFHFINILVGALIMAGGVLRCMVAVDEGEAGEINTFSDFVVGAYLVIFGFFIVMIEFAVPLFVVMHLGFLHTFFGKSVTYLFLGVLIVLGPPQGASPPVMYTFVAGVFIVFIAILYFFFQFFKAVERPRAMFFSPPKADEAA